MESKQPLSPGRFIDRPPEELYDAGFNIYVKQYWDYGPPVLLGANGPAYKLNWPEAFDGRDAPLALEIGSGNGFYLSGMAEKHPEMNWLGLEIRYKRVILCARKIKAKGVSNARIIRYDAWQLDDLFLPGSLSMLVTNHPDPWKKPKQIKKRLLNRSFVQWAERTLTSGATWRIKTDFIGHIDAVIDACKGTKLVVKGRSDDVLNEGCPWPESDDIVTNYESKFHKTGEKVYALLLSRE